MVVGKGCYFFTLLFFGGVLLKIYFRYSFRNLCRISSRRIFPRRKEKPTGLVRRFSPGRFSGEGRSVEVLATAYFDSEDSARIFCVALQSMVDRFGGDYAQVFGKRY